MEDIAKKLNIKSEKDWGKISRKQLMSLGGSGLLNVHRNLKEALSVAFPGLNHLGSLFELIRN